MNGLIIRADAGTAIGIGHIMRCIALGQGWRVRGGKVIFAGYCENNTLMKRLYEENFEFEEIKSDQPDLLEIEMIQDIVRRLREPSWIVLDGYMFSPEYQEALRGEGCGLLVVDDYNHLPYYHADILLNQNIGAEKIQYNCDPDTMLLLGPTYIMMRQEFFKRSQPEELMPETANRILITFGGSDPDNITLKVIDSLWNLRIRKLKIDIVVGPSNPNLSKVEKAVSSLRNRLLSMDSSIRLLVNPDMPQIMASADLAISAAGSTCWELAYMGLPLLAVVLAENQIGIAEGLEKAGAAINLGWGTLIDSDTLCKQIEQIIFDQSTRRSMSHTGKKMIDGKGVDRIISKMKSINKYIHTS
jgi:UDP-2,4-diacetamido-2,4,6-trideoxy-beta-L-altropyranose hydrolase